MRQTTRVLLVLTAALALAAMAAAPAGAGNQVERPFKASGLGTNTVNVDECVGTVIITCPFDTAATTIGTHVGKGEAVSAGTAVLDFGAPACVGTNGALGTPFVSNGDGVLTAADGSELYFRTVGESCFVDFSVPIGGGSTTYWFTGGTGRFAGASGTGSIVVVTTDGVLTTEWAGTITY